MMEMIKDTAKDTATEITFKTLGEWMRKNGNSSTAQLFLHPPKRVPPEYCNV